MFRVMTQCCSEGKGREQLISDRDTSVKLTIKKPSVENKARLKTAEGWVRDTSSNPNIHTLFKYGKE